MRTPDIDLALVPVENSIIGKIKDAGVDELKDLVISQEIAMPVPMSVGGLSSLEETTVIYSKDRALEQCTKYLSEFFKIPQGKMSNSSYIVSLVKEGKVVLTDSTAAAMELIKTEGLTNAAAIGYELGLNLNGLKIYAGDIGDQKGAETRFAVLAKAS